MGIAAGESYPLPEHPLLAQVAAALRDSGNWGWVVDHCWRVLFVTDEQRLSYGGIELASFAIGDHLFSTAAIRASEQSRFGTNTTELHRAFFAATGGYMLVDIPGGRDELRTLVDPSLHDVIDTLSAADPAASSFTVGGTGLGDAFDVRVIALRIRDNDGRLVGTTLVGKPAAGMATIAAMTFMGDQQHFERIQQLAKAGRRQAAILFADLEGSSALVRRLPTSAYFTLMRRLMRSADETIIANRGLIGQHAGDGFATFFPAETSGSESAAARGCIEAARQLRANIAHIAMKSGLQPYELTLRFGLHWGSTLYIGSIATRGRSEVTALGDEANEAARIEACATGGRALASKDLIERLDREDAVALGLGPEAVSYVRLADLETATAKARRDAPAIPVCEV